jgi:hypothetical protein
VQRVSVQENFVENEPFITGEDRFMLTCGCEITTDDCQCRLGAGLLAT